MSRKAYLGWLGGAFSLVLVSGQALAQPGADPNAPPAPGEAAPPAPAEATPTTGDTAPPAPGQAAPPTGAPAPAPAPQPYGQPAPQPAPPSGQPYGPPPSGQPYGPPPSYQAGYQPPQQQPYPPSPAYQYQPNPNAQRHDGVYFRFLFGPAYTSMATEDDYYEISGSGAAIGLALGGAISDNVVLYAELVGDLASGPEARVGNDTATFSEDVSAGVVGLGAGIAYYFMPANIYLSGTLAASSISLQEDGEEVVDTDYGLGVSAAVGKEWWVSDNWGLGVAGQLYLATMPEGEGSDNTWNASAVALVFSATYN